jgi:diphthine-ammonia ligase
VELLEEVVRSGMKVIISSVSAEPFDESWLGREIDSRTILELVEMRNRYGISPSGEGGEIETTVLDAPFFRGRIEIAESGKKFKDYSGVFEIRKASVVEK